MMKEGDVEYQLQQLFFDVDNPASFGGIDELYRSAKQHRLGKRVSKEKIREFLASQKTYTRHAIPKYHFKKRDTMQS